jgi:hypothetical protein
MVIRLGAPMFTFEAKALGPLIFKPLTFSHMVELEDAGQDLNPSEFVSRLILTLARRPSDTTGEEATRLEPTDVEKLLPEEREEITNRLISGLEYIFTDRSADDAGVEQSDAADSPTPLARTENESDEAYLQRGWLTYHHRQREKMSAALQPFVSSVSKIGEDIRKAMAPGLFANLEASQKVSDQIARMRHVTELGRLAFPKDERPAALPRPNIKNPTHETNRRLAALTDHLSEMRTLAANTAAMQETLNGYARDILTGFAVGAKESKEASDKALKVASVSAIGALLAVVVGIGAVAYQDWKSSQQQAAESSRFAAERELRQRETAATARLVDALNRAADEEAPQPKR